MRLFLTKSLDKGENLTIWHLDRTVSSTKSSDVTIKIIMAYKGGSSNCLLKTLEEPPLYAIIILIVTSLDLVEETVRSRCQIVRFSPLSKDFVKNNLINRFQLNANLAEQLALISNGSLERAISLADTQVVQ